MPRKNIKRPRPNSRKKKRARYLKALAAEKFSNVKDQLVLPAQTDEMLHQRLADMAFGLGGEGSTAKPGEIIIPLEETTQEQRRAYCKDVLGMTDAQIGDEEIPSGIFYLSNRPLTAAEEAHALTLVPRISEKAPNSALSFPGTEEQWETGENPPEIDKILDQAFSEKPIVLSDPDRDKFLEMMNQEEPSPQLTELMELTKKLEAVDGSDTRLLDDLRAGGHPIATEDAEGNLIVEETRLFPPTGTNSVVGADGAPEDIVVTPS